MHIVNTNTRMDIENEEITIEIEIDVIDDITDEEYREFESHVHELLYDILADDILLLSDPNFHENLVDDVMELYENEWDEVMDEDLIAECVTTAIESFFDIYEDVYPRRSSRMRDVESFVSESHIDYLSNLPQPAQRTTEWYMDRHQILTASIIWKVFASESQRNSLIYDKCKPYTVHDNGNWHSGGAMQWGVLYEPLSVAVYEKMFDTKIADFGCIKHSKHAFIGASPDGINVKTDSAIYGRMVEIKNIYNREITGIPKEEYWVQMQIQMETCGIDQCDFLETRFKEYATEVEFHADTAQEWKGVILCFLQRHALDSKPVYRYMPLDRIDDVNHWIDETKEELKETMVLYTTTYWYLDEFSCVLVKRNRIWFESALPMISATWDTIVAERVTGYDHRMAKKRVAPKLCLIKLE